RVGSEVILPKQKRINYPQHSFLSGRVSGATVARWLTERTGQFLGREFFFARLENNMSATRRRSRERWGLVTLPQPHMHYELYGDRPTNFESFGPLLAPRAPYFL